jgi:glycosyltransferase involved in cell wall biosynthesis
MATHSAYPVYADLRWPSKTGIGNVQTELLVRVPDKAKVVDLAVRGAIGSPLSPLAISRALERSRAGDGVFWNPGFIPPLLLDMPSVVTVHDLTHLHFYSRLHQVYYQLVFKHLYRHCSAVVCVSDFTRREFLAWSGMPAVKVHVVRNGVQPIYAKNDEAYGLPYRYVLYPGNHRGYKNIERLIEAFAHSSLPKQDIHLVMTGADNPALTRKAGELGVSSRVHFTGRVDDAELPRLYKGALLVAFVSLYEGFGLPLVEAMASGVPVLTSNVSAMPEVAGDAALVVDPYSVEAIADGLDVLAHDEVMREELVAKGLQRVKSFDWDVSARELWSIIDQAYRSG